jgi:hypothetical protein
MQHADVREEADRGHWNSLNATSERSVQGKVEWFTLCTGSDCVLLGWTGLGGPARIPRCLVVWYKRQFQSVARAEHQQIQRHAIDARTSNETGCVHLVDHDCM